MYKTGLNIFEKDKKRLLKPKNQRVTIIHINQVFIPKNTYFFIPCLCIFMFHILYYPITYIHDAYIGPYVDVSAGSQQYP